MGCTDSKPEVPKKRTSFQAQKPGQVSQKQATQAVAASAKRNPAPTLSDTASGNGSRGDDVYGDRASARYRNQASVRERDTGYQYRAPSTREREFNPPQPYTTLEASGPNSRPISTRLRDDFVDPAYRAPPVDIAPRPSFRSLPPPEPYHRRAAYESEENYDRRPSARVGQPAPYYAQQYAPRPGSPPRANYDPTRVSLRQREMDPPEYTEMDRPPRSAYDDRMERASFRQRDDDVVAPVRSSYRERDPYLDYVSSSAYEGQSYAAAPRPSAYDRPSRNAYDERMDRASFRQRDEDDRQPVRQVSDLTEADFLGRSGYSELSPPVRSGAPSRRNSFGINNNRDGEGSVSSGGRLNLFKNARYREDDDMSITSYESHHTPPFAVPTRRLPAEGYSAADVNKLMQLHLSEIYKLYGTALYTPAVTGDGVFSEGEVRQMLAEQQERHSALIRASDRTIVPPNIDVIIDRFRNPSPRRETEESFQPRRDAQQLPPPPRRENEGVPRNDSGIIPRQEGGSMPPRHENGNMSRPDSGNTGDLVRREISTGSSGLGRRTSNESTASTSVKVQGPPLRSNAKSDRLTVAQVNEMLVKQSQAIFEDLGAVLYCPPLFGSGTFSAELAEKVLTDKRRMQTTFESKPLFSSLEVNSLLEQQAEALQNKLGYSVMFTPIDDGKYTRDKVRKILRDQLLEHMDYVGNGSGNEKQAFHALNTLMHS